MSFNPTVKIARLFECTSKTGNTYYRGRLGFANVVLLKSKETADDGAPVWHLLVSEPERKQEYQPRTGRTDHQAPAEAPRTFERSSLDDEIPFAPEWR